MYKQIHLVLLSGAALALSACNNSAGTCPDCEDDMADEPIADLPCGGADLQNDDLHCGACGNECSVAEGDEHYRTGMCSAGECGPVWVSKYLDNPIGHDLELPPELTCEEVCAEQSTVCVAQGCAGLTGYTCTSLWGKGCSLTEPGEFPRDFDGACAEGVPWPAADSGYRLEIGCCCQF